MMREPRSPVGRCARPLDVEHATRCAIDRVALGVLLALVYASARPPVYQRDGFVYHLLGRDFLGGTNPHHLLWNGVQALITRLNALCGIDSVITFQLAGMICAVTAGVLLYHLLLKLTDRRAFAFAAALFVAFTPWTWFMAFQNQPYGLMFLLFVMLLNSFATPDGAPPQGRRFASAAAAAVGMVMLQQAAALIAIGVGVCFLLLSGWRRAGQWAAATGIPTVLLYVLLGGLKGVRDLAGFWRWTTGYLRSQHSLQVRLPDSLVKGAMGVISTFVNQDPFRDRVVDEWSASTILWFYGLLGVGMLAAGAAAVARRDRRPLSPTPSRAVVWVSVASMAAWSLFCFLWEPTNYYWFILLAPFFVYVAAELRPSRRTARALVAVLVLATAWNIFANHSYVDAAGRARAPEPQLKVVERNLRPNDLLWVVDLGWSGNIDYDLLATAAAFDHAGAIRSIADVVGSSRDSTAWQYALEDTTRKRLERGGRVFLSDRVFDPDTFRRQWETSPFADYEVERPYPIDWAALGRELPAFIERTYDIGPSGFMIGADSIWRLEPLRR